jgi:hypothetical protein
MAPLSFWRENQHRFPSLAALARDVLSIPATGSAYILRPSDLESDKMNDPELTRMYCDTYEKLTTWKDELEFLGYILCEVINPNELSARGFQCHQAVDLPAIVSMLQKASGQADGKPMAFMNNNERKGFRQLMNTCYSSK